MELDYSPPMQAELQEIKLLRKKYGLTQFDLAKQANVSQSLIAKVEAGRLDPTYSNAQKIFRALEDMGKSHELTAKDVMTTKIISSKPDDSIKDAIKRMKSHSISQIPVLDGHQCVGFISEALILEALLSGKGKVVQEVMGDSLPIVSTKTSIPVISNLLKAFPMVLVSDKGKLKGVISKSDILSKVY